MYFISTIFKQLLWIILPSYN